MFTSTRHFATAIVVGVGLSVIVGSATAAQQAPDPPPTSFCTLSPEPDALPHEGMLGSVRATADGLAVLHRVVCDGRTVGWRWLTSREIVDVDAAS
jgi:hypothetical protein